MSEQVLNQENNTEQEVELPEELTLEEVFDLAQQLHRKGFLDDAEPLYKRILEAEPNQSDTLHFLGLLKYQRGQKDAGLKLIQKSIELGPDMSGRFNNLGNIFLEMQRFEEATVAFRRALELDPNHADAYSNFGSLLKAQKQFVEAEKAYFKAIELNPEHADAYNNLGNLMVAQNRTREAVAYFCKAITLMPEHKEAKKLLGLAYYTVGEIDKAAEVYQEWLEKEPNNPVARHLLAACTRENVLPRAEDAYVEQIFDAFAESFDAKLGKLEYRAPQLIADKLYELAGTPEKQYVMLDAGCGTGLCGPLIADYAEELIGVDLSAGMLEKARDRGSYSELIKAELTSYIQSQHQRFDIIISADTLVYFGALEVVLAAAKQALRTNNNAPGLLLFTVEALLEKPEDLNYRLNPHGRYSHSENYLAKVLADTGFKEINLTSVELRMESGSPVNGFLVSAA